MVCVLSSTGNIYTRLWCLFEIFTAFQLGQDVRVATRYRGFQYEVFDNLFMRLCLEPINSRSAQCGIFADEHAIRGAIEASPGSYNAVDHAIENVRLATLLKSRERILGG